MQLQQACPSPHLSLESDNCFLKDTGAGRFFYPLNKERLLRSDSYLQKKPGGIAPSEGMATLTHTLTRGSCAVLSQHYTAVSP